MKKMFVTLALAVAACSATPALANEFGGVYGQGTVGYEDVMNRDGVTYGANAGVNIPVGDAIVGVEATVDNVFDDEREIGASARLGYTFGNTMLYGEAGYTNYRDVFSRELDGLRVGGGVELNLSKATFISAEYRYTDFDNSRAGKHAGLIGLGIRF
jgi:outer membrane immunogenic protein